MADIHPQLENDCLIIGRFPLCNLLLNKDANYPWFILVPDREDIGEIYQLSATDQQQLIRESSYLSKELATHFEADKMNVAALGNIVPQLHIHLIVRYKNDIAWPAPVWGHAAPKPYREDQLDDLLEKLRGLCLSDFVYSDL